MKIALVTMGTRGDVQPYIAVARGLMARGHEVTLAASDEHESLLRAYGVEHKSTPMLSAARRQGSALRIAGAMVYGKTRDGALAAAQALAGASK